MLQRSDPFKTKYCRDKEKCMVCRSGEKGGSCRTEGVTYKIECKGCDNIYIGETGRNAYTRGLEHIDDLEKQNAKSVLYRHVIEKHSGIVPQFVMTVTGVFGSDCTLRQVSEAVTIRNTPENKLINNKLE